MRGYQHLGILSSGKICPPVRHRHHAQKVKGPAQQEAVGGVGGAAWEYGHKALSLGILYYANRALANACAAASIKFPSPLIGGRPLKPPAYLTANPVHSLQLQAEAQHNCPCLQTKLNLLAHPAGTLTQAGHTQGNLG